METERTIDRILDFIESAAFDGNAYGYLRFCHPLFREINGNTGETLDLPAAFVRAGYAFSSRKHNLRFKDRKITRLSSIVEVEAKWEDTTSSEEEDIQTTGGKVRFTFVVGEESPQLIQSVFWSFPSGSHISSIRRSSSGALSSEENE